ncbi:MAG: hypothetical protein ACJ8GK_07655 [Luteimonas sp.]
MVFGGGWYLGAHASRRDNAGIEARLARLEQTATTAAEQEQGQAVAGPLPAGSVFRSARPALAPFAAPIPRPLPPEERRRLQLQAISGLESRFSADGSDPRWAGPTEEAVRGAISEPALAPFPAPQDSQVQCARTMCRLVFTFDSLDQAEDWASFYPLGLANQLPVFRNQPTTLPDGRVQLRMYGFRTQEAVPHG